MNMLVMLPSWFAADAASLRAQLQDAINRRIANHDLPENAAAPMKNFQGRIAAKHLQPPRNQAKTGVFQGKFPCLLRLSGNNPRIVHGLNTPEQLVNVTF
jgi:hypothetical protein